MSRLAAATSSFLRCKFVFLARRSENGTSIKVRFDCPLAVTDQVGRPSKCSHKLHVKDWLQPPGNQRTTQPTFPTARRGICLCGVTDSALTRIVARSQSKSFSCPTSLPSAKLRLPSHRALALDKDSIHNLLSPCLHGISVMLTLARYYPRMITC